MAGLRESELLSEKPRQIQQLTKTRSIYERISSHLTADMEPAGGITVIFAETGDAYIDHPSFGTAIISRVLEDAGFRVAILSQPDFRDEHDFWRWDGRATPCLLTPATSTRWCALHRSQKAPSRRCLHPRAAWAASVLTAQSPSIPAARRAFPDTPDLHRRSEASLRRFAHYDYWSDSVMPSVLSSPGADALMYGMSERSVVELAKNLKAGKHGIDAVRDIRGMAYFAP